MVHYNYLREFNYKIRKHIIKKKKELIDAINKLIIFTNNLSRFLLFLLITLS